jgi:Kef-type K+ transport system membrane component KefB/nucleotide-binding universal stress UspA family protein
MHDSPILILLTQVTLILAMSRIVGLIFRFLHQPQVMGEMVAGIMLGPSLFGLIFPSAAGAIFPPESIPLLNVLSQLGVIFFLFLVGLELDPTLLKDRGHAAVVISHVSIIAPFLFGAILALYLYPQLFNDAPRMKFTSVALFMGAAMSITAFPVLARILTERNIHKTRVGAIAITCAAVDDVTAWCMLAFVVGVARSDGLVPALRTAALAICFVTAMFAIVRPLLRRLQVYYQRQGRLSQTVVAVIFLLVLVSAYTTERIGIHALFGAFLMGAMMPKGTRFVRELSEKLEDYTVIFLLPIFFAYTGLRTQIGLLNNAELWMDTLLIILVACAGKFGGSALAGRACGLGWREASVIGVLMNTRGLMELVILNIGLAEGVITPAVFAMMVIMALVTTALTTPVLHWIFPHERFGAGEAAAKVQQPRRAYSILAPISLPESGPALARMAAAILGAGADRPNDGKLYALHLARPADHEAYRAGLDSATSGTADLILGPLMAQAGRLSMSVDPIVFVTRDVPADIAAVARGRNVDLVLMGFHKPVFGATVLGGKVHRVLEQSPVDVAILVDRGFVSAQKILVPFLGNPHDRAAMALAGRIANSNGATITVLHVVAPKRSADAPALQARQVVEKTFGDPTQKKAVTFLVIEDASPVDAVLAQANDYDLLVVGAAEQWGLESHLFGFRPERIVEECKKSLLMVHHSQT